MVWYIARNGKKKPLEWDDPLTAAAKGELTAEDLIWTPSMRAWARAGDALKFLQQDTTAEEPADQQIDGNEAEGMGAPHQTGLGTSSRTLRAHRVSLPAPLQPAGAGTYR